MNVVVPDDRINRAIGRIDAGVARSGHVVVFHHQVSGEAGEDPAGTAVGTRDIHDVIADDVAGVGAPKRMPIRESARHVGIIDGQALDDNVMDLPTDSK